MKTIDKIKWDGKKITIAFHEGDHDDPTYESTITSKDAPTPELTDCLVSLVQDVVSICELPFRETHLTVRGVSFSWALDIMGATITALYDLKKSDAPLVINTPHKSETPYSETGSEENCLQGETATRLRNLLCCGEEYLNGVRAQGTLFDTIDKHNEIMVTIGAPESKLNTEDFKK